MISASDTIIADVSVSSYPKVIPIDAFADHNDLKVYEIDAGFNAQSLTYSTHWTLGSTTPWNEAGTDLTVNSGILSAPTRVVVINQATDKQTDEVDNTDDFDGPTFEQNWDRVMLLLKYCLHRFTTCVREPEYDAIAELADKATRANSFYGFDANGDPTYLNTTAVVGLVKNAQKSYTIGSSTTKNIATVQIPTAEQGCLIDFLLFSENGALVRKSFSVIREAGASNVTANYFRWTDEDGVAGAEVPLINVSVSTDTATFEIDTTNMLSSYDYDVFMQLRQTSDGDVAFTALT